MHSQLALSVPLMYSDPSGPSAIVIGFWNGFGCISDDVGYGVVIALSPLHVNVVGIDLHKFEPHDASKTPTSNSTGLDFGKACEELIRLRSQFRQKPIIFISGEKPATMLSENADTLSKHFIFHWTKPEKLYRVIDKSRTPDLCREANVPTPTTHITSTGENVTATAREFMFPCIVKPNLMGQAWKIREGFPGRYFIAKSAQSLTEFYDQHPNMLGKTIWQQLIEGEDNNIFQCTTLVSRSGNPVASVCIRKLRQSPSNYGSMCYGRTEWNNEIVLRTQSLINAAGLNGYASAEFKYDRKTDEYYFIELNPRLPAYNALFPQTGINLAYLGYLDLYDEKLTTDHAQRNDVYWMTIQNLSAKEPLRSLKDGTNIAWKPFLDSQVKPYVARNIYQKYRQIRNMKIDASNR